MLFTLIFLLHGGRNIYGFVTRIVPAGARERVRDAGRAGFGSLIGYVRATFLVALVDAVGIGTGLAIMGVPLALPLASLVFLGAFIPLVGAVISGFLAVIVALLAKGFVYALITLGLIIAVQQLEAHVLQPLVMGRAVVDPSAGHRAGDRRAAGCWRASSGPCWRCRCWRSSTARSGCWRPRIPRKKPPNSKPATTPSSSRPSPTPCRRNASKDRDE